MSNQCRGCRAQIHWITTRAGKPMPCDPELRTEYLVPQEDASVEQEKHLPKLTVITTDGVVHRGYRGTVLTAFAREVTGRVPHWATCPDALRFRSKGDR